MSVPIPHWLDYASAKPSDIGSYQETYFNYPNNGSTFTGGQTTIIPIGRCGDQAVLDPITSTLQFTIDSAIAFTIEGTAASYIKQIQVWFESQVIEFISNYDGLFNALFDSQVDLDDRTHQYNITHGCGTTVATPFTGAVIAAADSCTVSLPILSCVLGALSRNYIPLYMLTNGNITLRVTWNDDTAAVAAAAAPGLAYTNIMYKANIIYLNERIISQISSTPLTLYGESYANL